MAESGQRSNSTTTHSSVLPYSPIITKVDAPIEDSVLANELEDDKGFNVCTPNVQSKKKPFDSPLKPSILKPPQLNVSSSTDGAVTKPFLLNPPKLNPFVPKIVAESTNEKKEEGISKESPQFIALATDRKDENKADKSVAPSTARGSTISSTSFVFGQNLEERVAGEIKNEDPKPSTSLNTNGTTDMLFSNAIKNDIKTTTNNVHKENKSLSESAREYEESRAVKRKYEEVEVVTGEEEETNILCISCKLFSFDGTTGTWRERGRGTLRLNDFDIGGRYQSRLVFRTSGSFRVILNTKIFAKMSAEKASDKSIRLTALDANGEIKVFLVMASIDDSKALLQSLEQRIKLEIEASEQEKS